ncbi:MAG: 3,4-dihydroxy-2-butanone-4-phosphate synthase [Bacteroidetes bacterium GWB2_41_8]|nr:MAG: 3,4-dihydroxy-2-butanone-4-phosphate synthase [Bacteroidetes bacterium GWB2_41_8]
MENSFQIIEEAINDIKTGAVVIVADDENRENEGDFIIAAELITPEIVNFMTIEGRGLICAALTAQRCKELNLELMVANNSSANRTNFTVSVDLVGYGCSTGISAEDRSKTLRALADKNFKPEEFGRPGHIFPIIANEGGVRVRPGHTEAAVELMKLAGLQPVGVLIEIMNPDGTMARYSDLKLIAARLGLKLITIKKLIDYLNEEKK